MNKKGGIFMAETQSTNLKLDLVDGDSLFDTGKVKSNFEKIDTAVGSLTENSAKLHITQISKTTDNYGQIGTNIPNAHILSAWCNQDLSVVVPLSGTGTGLRVYVANESSQTSETLRQLKNTAVVINGLYYDFS